MSVPASRYTLYRFFDADGDLLYIGVTARGPVRFAEHIEKEWWLLTASLTIEHLGVISRIQAMDIEAAAIRAESPPYNADPSEVRRQSEPLRQRNREQWARWRVARQAAAS